MKRHLHFFAVAASGLIFIAALNISVVAQTKKASAVISKTERMLKEIKANYSPFQGKGTFIVSYKGKEKAEIDVILIETEDVVVILADVAAGKEIDLTLDLMKRLLEYNTQTDYIKVGISDLGSIRVQSEQELLAINGKIFGKILDQVAAGADEVAKILAPGRKGTAVN